MSVTTDTEFALLCAVARDTIGLHLEGYKSRQLDRRLSFFRQRYNLSNNTELAHRLRTDSALRKEFADFLTINVTEFFRNPDRFQVLKERYLPTLLQQRQTLRIWSAGCSQGSEVYTLALLVEQLTPARRHQFLATDIDEASLARARAGVYPESELRQVPADLRKNYFREAAGGYQIAPQLRAQVEFRRHDLLRDPFPVDMDLILCRNVVIYFTEQTKLDLYRRFFDSLRPGGVLFIGSTESIFEARGIGLRYMEPCFYQKPLVTSPAPATGTTFFRSGVGLRKNDS